MCRAHGPLSEVGHGRDTRLEPDGSSSDGETTVIYSPPPLRSWTRSVLHSRLHGTAKNLSMILDTLARWQSDHPAAASPTIGVDGMVLTSSKDMNTLRFCVEFTDRPDRDEVRAAHALTTEFAEYIATKFRWSRSADGSQPKAAGGTPFLLSGAPARGDHEPAPFAKVQQQCHAFREATELELYSCIVTQRTSTGQLCAVPSWTVTGSLPTGMNEQTLGSFASRFAAIAGWISVRIWRFGLGSVDLEHGCCWPESVV